MESSGGGTAQKKVPGRGQKTGLVGVDSREQSWETEVRDVSFDTQILGPSKRHKTTDWLTGLEWELKVLYKR